MTGERTPLKVLTTARFDRAYLEASAAIQASCHRVILALANREPTPGQRVKPVLPDKYFHEARLNRSDRLIFRTESGKLELVDIVAHDDIDRYARR